MSKTSQSNVLSVNNQLIGALQKYLAKKTIMLAGKTWSTQDLVTAFANENAAIAASASAKATWVKAVATVTEDRATNDALRAALHQAVLVQFGTDPSVLDGFGYKQPGKRGIASPVTKVLAAAKRLATRKARGTLGSKQRKAISGALTTPQQFAVTLTAAGATVVATPVAAEAPAAATPVSAPNGTTTQK
jgi:hypothetical protein